MKTLFTRMTLLFMLALTGVNTAWAENMKKLGNYNVHYIALGATFITPEIAKTYGIERSRYNGLINVSVLDNSQPGNPAKAVMITGKAQNDIGQFKSLDFKEVKESEAIYYLAQVSYRNEETINFEITIDDGKKQQSFTFSQKFYVD